MEREHVRGIRGDLEQGGGAGAAGTAAELAVGFGLAQQMMQQGFAGGSARDTGRIMSISSCDRMWQW